MGETCSSASSVRMNDLTTLCNLPFHVWWHTVFYCLGVCEPACMITLAIAHHFLLCFTVAMAQFHHAALGQQACSKLNCKLMVSRCCSHELIVSCTFEHTKRRCCSLCLSLSLSELKLRTLCVYIVLFHRHPCMEEGLFIPKQHWQDLCSTCMRVLAAYS